MMRVVTFGTIKEFIENHPDAEIALITWYHTATAAQWNNLYDMKQTFGSVDYVGNNRYVFNVKGNKYRLVAIVIFASHKVYIRFIGTHARYDKIDCSTV